MKKSVITLFLFAGMLASCAGQAGKAGKGETTLQAVQDSSIISEAQYKELGKKSVTIIPDSLRTKEQQEMYVRLCDFLYKQGTLELKDDHFKLLAGRKDFEEAGIPDFYYDIIRYELNLNNVFVDSLLPKISQGDLDIAASFEETKERYWKQERARLMERIPKPNVNRSRLRQHRFTLIGA